MSLLKKFIRTVRENPGEAARKVSRRLLPHRWLERKDTSFAEHNRHYSDAQSLEWHRACFARYAAEDLFNAPANRIRDLIAKHPDVREIAVDLGCGAGWASAELGTLFKRVIAIEPSAAALGTARAIFPASTHANIEWHNGFSEDVLATLDLPAPALWITMVVLSHLPDKSVARICAAVNRAARPGSLLSFSECWGPEFHDFMWHVRTPEWWRTQLPGWELDFHGPNVNDVPNRRKGIHGRKIR